MSDSRHFVRIAVAFLAVMGADTAWSQERAWSVSRSSGEVWVASPGAQPVSLSSDIRPGDTIRTGRNGRVLLIRGEESILVSPNSSIAVPKDGAEGTSTTILQQAGSILLEVEKRNVKHFEVQTPSLAAVVKGTQFRISVGATGTSVSVIRGQVEVAHFKTGQIAQIMPGQTATSFAQGKLGLSLSGSGSFSPIEQGKPRSSPVDRLIVPKGGLTAPRQAGNAMQVRSIAQGKAAVGAPASQQAKASSLTSPRAGTRISAAIGDVRLNFSKVTQGLARGTGSASSSRAAASSRTIWSSDDLGARTSGAPGGGAGAAAASASIGSAVSSNEPGNSNVKGNRGNHGGHGKEHANNGKGPSGNNGNGGGNNGQGSNGGNGNSGGNRNSSGGANGGGNLGNSGGGGGGNIGNNGNGNSGGNGNGNGKGGGKN